MATTATKKGSSTKATKTARVVATPQRTRESVIRNAYASELAERTSVEALETMAKRRAAASVRQAVTELLGHKGLSGSQKLALAGVDLGAPLAGTDAADALYMSPGGDAE